MIIHVALLAQLVGTPVAHACVASPSAPALDHTIVVVRNLEQASAAFRGLGFRFKPGRLHANGLLNSHIKFRDGSEVELMTVQGRPGDEMARDYAALLEAGEGGVYVALDVRGLADAQRIAAALGLETRRSASGAWQFVSFPATSPAAAVFFSSGNATAQDPDSVFRHDPAVSGLVEVWLEGDAALGDLLHGLGAARCGSVPAADDRRGERWSLGRGSVVIVPPRGNARPRVLGAVLGSPAPVGGTLRPVSGFWLHYR